MMAEVTPPGFDNLVSRRIFQVNELILWALPQFFGLYGLSSRTASMIGPYVIQAIIDDTGNKWMGFRMSTYRTRT